MWVNFLPWAEYLYNTSLQSAAKHNPFEVGFGRNSPSLARFIPEETMVKVVAQNLMNQDEALKQLKYHLTRPQEQMKKFEDKTRKPSNIQVGDMVYLKIRLHRQHSMPTKMHPKLSLRYYGLFLVEAKVRAVAFRLQLHESTLIHPLFHASQLKRAVGAQPFETELPPELQVQGSKSFPNKFWIEG